MSRYILTATLLGMLGWAVVAVVIGVLNNAFSKDYLVTTVSSFHFDRNRDYNEKNLGLGLERRFSESWSGSTGYFRNSFDRDSLYVFAGYTPVEVLGWRTGIVMGAVTGYENRVSPWVTGLLMRDFENVGVNIVVAPAGLALQLKWALD